MNKKVFKLKRGFEIKRVIRKGLWKSESRVIAYITKHNKPFEYNRFAVCVSKKNGNSVQRNRLKRLVREANFQLRTDEIRNSDIVIILKKTANVDNTNYDDIYKDLSNVYETIKKHK